jgi:hypothetical protein
MSAVLQTRSEARPVRGNQARLGLPPTAARTAGPFEGSDAPHGALRAMIHAARPHHFPEGHDPLGGWRRFLQLVMDDKRLSANLLLGSWRGSTLVWVLSSLRDLDKVRVCLFLQSKARCMVRREDCGPRREGAAAPTPVRQGASSRRSLQLRPRPRSWPQASSPFTSRRVARDPRRVPPLEAERPHASHCQSPLCQVRRRSARGWVRQPLGGSHA